MNQILIKGFYYVKNSYEAKYQLLINITQDTGLKYFNDSKALIDYSNDMNKIQKNIKE